MLSKLPCKYFCHHADISEIQRGPLPQQNRKDLAGRQLLDRRVTGPRGTAPKQAE